MSVYPIDQYQNADPQTMKLHELKKSVNFNSISHLYDIGFY